MENAPEEPLADIGRHVEHRNAQPAPEDQQPQRPPQLYTLQQIHAWITNNRNAILRATNKTALELRQLYTRDLAEVVYDFVGFYDVERARALEAADYLGVFIRLGWLPSPEWIHNQMVERFGDAIDDLLPLSWWQRNARGLYDVATPDHSLSNCLVCLNRPCGMPVVRHQSHRCPFATSLLHVALMLLGRTCKDCGKRDAPARRPSHRCNNPQLCFEHNGPPRHHLPFLCLCHVPDGQEQAALDSAERLINAVLRDVRSARFALPLDRGHPIPTQRPPYRGLVMSMTPLSLPPNFQRVVDMERRLKALVSIMERDMRGDTVSVDEFEAIMAPIEEAERLEVAFREQRIRDEQLGYAMANRNRQMQNGFQDNARAPANRQGNGHQHQQQGHSPRNDAGPQ